jgi:DNA helicase II / ATP-dependent DNA helicase PcrA
LVSCPGSGKTRTLVAKALDTLPEVRDTTRLIACITYTNAAVHEIESRLSEVDGSSESLCEIETIHSFCLKHILAPHAWLLPRFAQGFSVLAPDDLVFRELVDDIVTRYRLDGHARDDFEQLGRGTGRLPAAIPLEAAEEFWAELDRRRLMDFAGMIFWAAQLVQGTPRIARGLASRYRWILVDEFQDTSSLQVGILRAIHDYGRTRFFIVGDPHQSIMSFAGGRPELMMEFGGSIRARSDIQLLDNHRSSQRILELAEALCPRPSPMKAVGKDRDHGFRPTWHRVPAMLDGIRDVFLPEVIKNQIPLRETAILASWWMSLLPLARALRDDNIPVIGPGARPYKRSTHVVAPLVEEVAAYVTEPIFNGLIRVRREIRRLVQTLTARTYCDLGFAGDVCAARLIRVVRGGSANQVATKFLEGFSAELAAELVTNGFVTSEHGQLIERSGRAMIDDINQHESSHHLRTTTARDLGVFARGSNSIRLLTMHAAKGREFDAVALIDVFDGRVPHFTAHPGSEIEAEGRRLLYVALTRARKILMVFTLTNPVNNRQPSRFLHQLAAKGFLTA